jgi:hypothetical protein
VAAMEQLLQEDMAAYGTGCLPESFVGSSSYSFCPCPGQQDSASWAEFEDDGVQELLQAEARQLLRGEYFHVWVQWLGLRAPRSGAANSTSPTGSLLMSHWQAALLRCQNTAIMHFPPQITSKCGYQASIPLILLWQCVQHSCE